MNISEKSQLIPEQTKGGKTGATASLKQKTPTLAKALFRSACQRLVNVNAWYEFAGKKGLEFQLTDPKGNDLHAEVAKTGNLIRIKAPGPANKDGDGYDWVRIEEIVHSRNPEKDEQMCGFRVRPVDNPLSQSTQSAHFYTSDATSSFMIVRKGKTVYAMERGRNEQPNTSGGLLSKIRNFLIAVPAMLGLSVPFWKIWANGILKPKNG